MLKRPNLHVQLFSPGKIPELKDKIEGIFKWLENEKGISEVRVTDMIFPDTTINGIYSSLALKQIEKNVLIKEQKYDSPDDMLAWKMKINIRMSALRRHVKEQ